MTNTFNTFNKATYVRSISFGGLFRSEPRFSVSTGTVIRPLNEQFVKMLVAATQARRVLEVGVFMGYSVTAMADVLPADGCFTTCTINSHHADDVAADVADSPYTDRVDIRVGRAIETMKTLDGPFDLIFLGANKRGYPEYYEASLDLLSPNGVIVVDNSFRLGAVPSVSSVSRPSWNFQQLSDRLADDYRVICVQVPVREGVTLILRR